jgi:signal peptidase II
MAVLWLSFAVVVFDQLTKFYIKGSPWSWPPFKGMAYGNSIHWIDDIVRITYIENPGIAFGINIPRAKVFFSVFSIVASIAIIIYLKRNLTKLTFWERIALASILGGAIGNLIDRVFYGVFYGTEKLFYGRVVDFIDFGYQKNWWPVFNVADSAVSCGVVLLIILMMMKKPAKAGTVSFEPTHDSSTVTIEPPSDPSTQTAPGFPSATRDNSSDHAIA